MKILGLFLIGLSLIVFGRSVEAGYDRHYDKHHIRNHYHKHGVDNYSRDKASSDAKEPANTPQRVDEVTQEEITPLAPPRTLVDTTVPPSGGAGGGIVIGCSDPKALNYSKWAVSLPNESCDYIGRVDPIDLKKLSEALTEARRALVELIKLRDSLIEDC